MLKSVKKGQIELSIGEIEKGKRGYEITLKGKRVIKHIADFSSKQGELLEKEGYSLISMLKEASIEDILLSIKGEKKLTKGPIEFKIGSENANKYGYSLNINGKTVLFAETENQIEGELLEVEAIKLYKEAEEKGLSFLNTIAPDEATKIASEQIKRARL